MYLTAATSRAKRGRTVARGSSIPAPVKGWNVRDPLDGMDSGYAVVLDNWFPQTNYVELRRGYEEYATGVGGTVETLMEYRGAAARKFLACGNGSIYDISSDGAVGTALATGLTSNRWQFVNFGGYLIFVNGADTPRKYDGSTVSTTSFTGTGLTATDLIGIQVFKNRLFLIEEDSASFWYGGLSAITGALTEFDLSEVYPEGGKLLAIGTLTNDGGAGIDDLCAFLMDSGTVLIYAGTDPGDASAWSLIGRFEIGKPVGRRPLLKIGPDLIVITADGYVPLLQYLRVGRSRGDKAVSDAISGAVNAAVRDQGALFGWQALLYPRGNMAIFNVPVVADSSYQQHVVNTITGAWCRFTGQNAVCWSLYDDDLYFGGADGSVYKADTGLDDDNGNIQADGQTAYQYFGGRGQLKRFSMYRPILASDGDLPVSLGIGVDFASDVPTFTASSVSATGALWDEGEWDVASWGGAIEINKGWQSANALGYSASVRVRTETSAQTVRWFSTDITYELGAYI